MLLMLLTDSEMLLMLSVDCCVLAALSSEMAARSDTLELIVFLTAVNSSTFSEIALIETIDLSTSSERTPNFELVVVILSRCSAIISLISEALATDVPAPTKPMGV